MNGLVLSLFPGIGLLDMAFEQEGFCVVRGPDLLWGGDIRRFHPPAGKFEGVIGGPPCQAFSRLRYLVQHNGYRVAENLIPEFERCVREAAPGWFLMENVPDAPVPRVAGYRVRETMIRDVWVGGETNRQRRFSFGSQEGRPFQIETLALHRTDPELSILASGGHREVPVALLKGGKRKKRHTGQHLNGDYFAKAVRLQGLPAGYLSDAPFTVEGKIRVVGNGVPLAMGRAVARAVKAAIGPTQTTPHGPGSASPGPEPHRGGPGVLPPGPPPPGQDALGGILALDAGATESPPVSRPDRERTVDAGQRTTTTPPDVGRESGILALRPLAGGDASARPTSHDASLDGITPPPRGAQEGGNSPNRPPSPGQRVVGVDAAMIEAPETRDPPAARRLADHSPGSERLARTAAAVRCESPEGGPPAPGAAAKGARQ